MNKRNKRMIDPKKSVCVCVQYVTHRDHYMAITLTINLNSFLIIHCFCIFLNAYQKEAYTHRNLALLKSILFSEPDTRNKLSIGRSAHSRGNRCIPNS